MDLDKYLKNTYPNDGSLFYNPDLISGNSDFEKVYISTRKLENRIFSKYQIVNLPQLSDHPLTDEWKFRKLSCERSIKEIIKLISIGEGPIQIVEIGCGNGWFSNKLLSTDAKVLGVDINSYELMLANSAFNHSNLIFLNEDIMKNPLPKNSVDIFIFNSSIQYFSVISNLMSKLRDMLKPNGSIVITDSPIYTTNEIQISKDRSRLYFQKIKATKMIDYYHHHVWTDFEQFSVKILYDPTSLINQIKSKITKTVEFPIFTVKFY